MIWVINENEIVFEFANKKSIEEYLQNLKTSPTLQSSVFNLDFVKDKDFHRYSLVPSCIINPKKWNSAEIAPDSKMNQTSRSIRTNTRAIFIELQVDVKFDSNFVETSKTVTHSATLGRFAFTPKNNKIETVSRIKPSRYYYEDELEPLDTVSWCP